MKSVPFGSTTGHGAQAKRPGDGCFRWSRERMEPAGTRGPRELQDHEGGFPRTCVGADLGVSSVSFHCGRVERLALRVSRA